MPLCFSYGSNMDRAAMATRCQGARSLGLARLERHRLALMKEGYLTVARDPRRAVHGVLWDVPLADMPALDRYEEIAGGLYVKRHLAVAGQGGPKRALVYIGTNAGPGRPRPGYLEGVIAAAQEAGLPAEALTDLRTLIPKAPTGPLRQSICAPAVRPRAATPFDRPRESGSSGWRWKP